jgi:phosphatidylglycerophosphate synthase
MAPNPFLEDQLGALHRGAGTGAFAVALWRRAAENARARPDLVRELRVVRRGGALVAVGVALALTAEGVPGVPAVWLLVLTWLLLCGWTWAELGLIRHPLTDEPGRHIGPANVMTLFRGWAAVPVSMIALYRPGPTLAWVVLCLMAGFTDLFDGSVAIRLGHESRLGRLLDPVLDACFFSAAGFALARWGLLPAWMAALVALRYFIPVLGGLALLIIRGRSLPVRHTPWGQRSTLATGVALFVTWLATRLPVPAWVLPGLYAIAVLNMALALGGIVRRAPRAA